MSDNMTLKQWKPKQMKKAVTVIGAAIADVLVGPVNQSVFEKGSQSVDMTKLSFGGDALNEAVVLSRMGISVDLVSKVGKDETGTRVLHFLEENGVSAEHVMQEKDLVTGINVVLVDEAGERCFLTNPRGSLRKLSLKDVETCLPEMADIVSFASVFVSPLLDIEAMESLFQKIKAKPGSVLVADMTKPKNGETLVDIKKILTYIDYLLPNEEEVFKVTGVSDVYESAKLLVEAGTKCVIMKRGDKGCLIQTKEKQIEIPAFKVEKVVDTTGAGDCFVAGFLWGLSQDLSLEDCGCLACATASCAVECMGATDGIISAEEVWRRYEILKER